MTQHTPTFGRMYRGRGVYVWSAVCSCGGWGSTGPAKRDVRAAFTDHLGGLDSLGRRCNQIDPASPGYRLAADATRFRLALELARHGLTAALLDPSASPRSLRRRCAEVADMLTDVVDQPAAQIVVLP